MTILDWSVIAFLLAAASERLYARRYSRWATRGRVKMRWTLVTLDLTHALIYCGSALEYFLLRRKVFWPVSLLGLSAYAVSVFVRHAAIRTLGKFWSLHLEMRENHQLVREGIYQYVRHPAYSAIMMEVIAIPLVAGAYYTLFLSMGAYLPVLLVRWAGEEREMVGKFGEQYRQYQQEVPAFFPWLR